MKYAFLLPAYKARFFEEALGSILSQTYKDFEVIVSDDCSPEDLKSIVDKFSDPRVTYRRNEKNIGAEHLVDHWNMLLGLTDAEYIIMASDDDVYDERYLEEMDKLTKSYPEANVLRPLVQMIDPFDTVTCSESPCDSLLSTERFICFWATGKVFSGVPYYLFKKKPLIKNGGFLKFPYASYSDDATVIINSNNGVAVANTILFSFRQSDISISYSFSRDIVRGKIEAARRFNKEVLCDLPVSEEVREKARTRVRRILRTDASLGDSSFRTRMNLLLAPSEKLLTMRMKTRILKDIIRGLLWHRS